MTWEQVEPFQAFTVGDVAFTENGNWQLGTAKANAHFTYGVTMMPWGPSRAAPSDASPTSPSPFAIRLFSS